MTDLRSDDDLGTRLGAALREREDGPGPSHPRVPFAALQRRAERRRRSRRLAIAATTGAGAVAVGGFAGTDLAGRDDRAADDFAASTPAEQAADLAGRYLPSRVPADLSLSHVVFQGTATSQIYDDVWHQVFAPPGADVAHPGLLVQTTAPAALPTFGVEVSVGDAPGVLVTRPNGALELWVTRSDATLYLKTGDLGRDQLLATAASAVLAPDAPGVILGELPAGWRETASAASTIGPEIGISWFGAATSSRYLNLQVTAPSGPSAAFAGGQDQGALPHTLADGTVALLVRASDGALMLWWLTPEGGTIALQSGGLDETEILAIADSVALVDRDTWEARTADASVENYLAGRSGSDDGSTETTSPPTTSATGPDQGWRTSGWTLADLPVGTWRLVEPNGYPSAVARTAPDTVVGLVLFESNRAGACDIQPAGSATPIRPAGPTTGSVDAADPDAVAFTNDCTGATYSLTGDVIDGSAVGLGTFDVRVTADGAIEISDTQHSGRAPAAG
jgi:hypothetical protein